jgi:hypothetical protein
MRKAITPQHQSTFYKQGFITFEQVLQNQEIELLKGIEKHSTANECLIKLAKKKQLGEIAYELLGKEPLRLAKVYLGPLLEFQDGDLALIIDLQTGSLLYTRVMELPEDIESSLIVIFTPRYLDPIKHPVVFRKG